MDAEHYASIDVGSNAVRLLIKRLEDPAVGRFSKVVMMRVPLRLGQDVFTQGFISADKAETLRKLMKAYAIVMKIYKIKKRNFRGCATAAMREASNGEDVLRRASESMGYKLEIIEGAEEAEIACESHVRKHSQRRLLYVDVGGGSTEVSLFENGQKMYSMSYAMGTVRMINNVDLSAEMAKMESDMTQLRQQYAVQTIVGAGGNINKLYALVDKKDSAEQTMSVDQLRAIYDELSPLTIEERTERYNLKPDRADVIVPAAEIFIKIASIIGAENIEVPATGLSDGIIEDIFCRQKEKKSKRSR